MRGRRGGGAGSGGGAKFNSSTDRILRRHIASAGTTYPTVEQLVDHLRSSYPHYARHKLQPFTKRVDNIMQATIRRNGAIDEPDDDFDSPITKKKRKADEKEEKLLRIEAQHLRRRSNDVVNDSGGVSSSSLASVSSSGEDDSSDQEASTSEDAIYGEQFEPEFDLMKSMMRENLRGKSKKLGNEREVKEAVELEVVDNRGVKDVCLVNEEGKLGDGLSEFSNKTKKCRDGNEINGPMFKDLGGMAEPIEQLKRRVLMPFYHPQIPLHFGVKPTAGILLHGPPGCGKTTMAQAIANETGVPFYKISATELVSGVSGASEENIRELFSKANRTAPSIVFIDEIDAIASKRENSQRGMELRIVTQLMTCMDESCRLIKPVDDNASSESRPGYVLVIGATNRPDAVDPALRRPGRFDREIVLGVPDERARVEILSVLTRDLKVEGVFDIVKVARSTPGFVGADLEALVNEAANVAMDRIIDKRKEQMNGDHGEDWWKPPLSDEEIKSIRITMADFEEAAKKVQPSSRREGFSDVPNVKWDAVGGLHLLRQAFDRYIIRRIKFPEDYEGLGLDTETGFLLYGPPGCGKTLIAMAVANEAGASFIHIKGPELLNKYVGESELAVRTIFSRARTCSPCILFFDEVDALTMKHDKEGEGVVGRILKQLLIELDGADQRKSVFVIGATNRPEVIDPALLRPGRFGKLVYVPLPSADERGMILKALVRNKPVDPSVDLMAIGRDGACENLTGADLSALMSEATFECAEERRRCGSSSIPIKDEHFKSAMKKISPSVTNKQREHYKILSESLRAA
ncbi:hypothetical protein ACS0TY_009327 [Phlomoides rotata]